MSQITRRSVIKWGMAGIGAAALAACAPKAQPTAAPAAAAPVVQPTTPPKAEVKVIELRFLTRQGEAGVHMREFGKRYMDESNGKITITMEEAPWGEVQKILETQLVTDTMVDATWGDTAWWPYLAKRGAFASIEEFVAEKKMDLTKWFNIEWFRKWTDGKLSGLGGAAGFHPGISFYNKKWVVEAWGKEPWDDWTIDDYVSAMDACVKLKGGPGKGFFGGYGDIGGGHGVDGYIRNWGGGIINQDGTQSIFADPKTQDSIKFQREMIKSGLWMGRDDAAEGQLNMFLAQKQAIYISNPGASQGMSKGSAENGIDMGVVMYPKGPAAKETPPRIGFIPYANTFGIYSKTKYPREAFGIIERVTSQESMKWLCLTTGKQPGALLDTWYDKEVNEKFPWFARTADVMKGIKDNFAMPANTRYSEWAAVGANEIPPLIFDDVEYNQANVQMVSDHLQEIIDLPMPGGS